MLPSPGIPPITAPVTGQRLDEPSLVFRLQQRLTAEVLQVTADHVVLALEGVPVVARLTSPDQAAVLKNNHTAQFVVQGFTGQTLTLQLVNPEAGEAHAPAAGAPLPDPIPALLEQMGLPATETNRQIARALLSSGLNVTPETVAQMEAGLAGLAPWGEAQAQAAARLLAAGLPVSPGAIRLALAQPAQVAELLTQLQTQLRQLSAQPLSPRLAELTQNALAALNALEVDWSAPPETLAAQLRQAVTTLGHPVERDLATLIRGLSERPAPYSTGEPAANPAARPGLLALAELRGELARTGLDSVSVRAHEIIGGLDRLLDTARLAQLTGAAAEPAGGHWLSLNLPVWQANPPAHRPAHLRVAYRPGGGGKVDAANTRVVLEVELEPGRTLLVDLSVVDRQIGARVAASNADLRDQAQAEMPGLEAGLKGLGFTLKTARFEVKPPSPGHWPRETRPTSIQWEA